MDVKEDQEVLLQSVTFIGFLFMERTVYVLRSGKDLETFLGLFR